MSDQNSIFDSNQSSTQTNTNTGPDGNQSSSQNVDPIANLLGTIKNERGEQKYKTLEDALKALQHSQEYIPQLTTQLSEREQQLAEARREADRVAELEKSVLALTQSNSNSSVNPSTAISEETIAEIVSKTLTRNQQAELQKQNINSVVSAMQTTFGEKAEQVFYDRAKELGMTVTEFNALAARTPKAVLDLIGAKAAPPSGMGAPQSSVNSGAFAPQQQSFIGRNKIPTLIGATSQDLMSEAQSARKMVEELHAQGKSVHDLADPKVYMTMFNK